MLLQQFLPAIRQIASEFFIFQQESALAQRLLPTTLSNAERC